MLAHYALYFIYYTVALYVHYTPISQNNKIPNM